MYDFSSLPELDENYRLPLPDCSHASSEGILGVGGNLSPGILLSAYEQGIFPWFSPGEPILWWSPDPRFVVHFDELHLSRRTRRYLQKSNYRVTMDRDFGAVISNCARVSRKGEAGTWITETMADAYHRLHELGYAHSVEVWLENELIGGLYGVTPGAIFCGESMFSLRNEASKLAFLALSSFLQQTPSVTLIDSQVANPHMESLGGRNISRESYLDVLREGLQKPRISGWGDYSASAEQILAELN